MSNLRREVEAIEYEHWMLHETGRLLASRRDNAGLVETNARIESHATHLRNIIEFLFDRSGSPKLMRASDPIYGAKWNEGWPEGVGKVYGRASEEVAHLSRGRVAHPKTSWVPQHSAEVEVYFQRWLSGASDEVQRLFREAQTRHPSQFEIAAAAPPDPHAIIDCNTLATNRVIGQP